jgi:hypothetical protein
MSIFIVESPIPVMGIQMAKLIPKQRDFVEDMFQKGFLLMYAVTENLDKWWCSVEAENEEQVWEFLSQMPIIEFLTPTVHSLMFYNSADQMIPPISLN